MRKLLFLSFLLFWGCEQPGKNVYLEELPYYDLAGLIDQQIRLLDSIRPDVVKVAFYEGKEETNRLKPDSSQWANLLELFKNADINKPVLRGQYIEKSGQKDSNSNLNVRMYEPENPENVNVQYLKVYYVDELDDVRKIEVRIKEDNVLFKGVRDLRMELIEDGEGNLLLSSYSIKGIQKMVMIDSVTFKIEAEVIL